MIIDRIFPKVVGEKDTLRNRFLVEATARGLTDEKANAMLSSIPHPLVDAKAFLDKLTGLWRYEFGLPYDVKSGLVWGTHMWRPVDILFSAISVAHFRLSSKELAEYLKKLADWKKHQDFLVEMIPACKIDSTIPMKYEDPLCGADNKKIDWTIGPHGGRTVLLDVKRRIIDFIEQADQMNANVAIPQPNHDPLLLFRSVEEKFTSADPDVRLQGVWIVTDLKQDEIRLHGAFATLDNSKVHFAILGDWKPDAHILVQREQDREYLKKLFQLKPSTRFSFKNATE